VNLENIKSKIGSKGEIFPPKEIREELGLTKGQPILLTIHDNKLIIRKLHTIESILEQPAKVKIEPSTFKQFRKSLSAELEK